MILQENLVLVVKPTYKKTWLLPGGVVEKGESIFQASLRECAEEIGVEVEITKLLVVDYKPGDSLIGDAIHFLFLAQISKGQILKIDGKEIEEFKWVPPSEAIGMLGSHLALRLLAGMQALKIDQTVYCEDGEIFL